MLPADGRPVSGLDAPQPSLATPMLSALRPSTVRGRFQLATTALALALLLPGMSGWWSMRQLAARADDAVQQAVLSQRRAGRFVAATLRAVQYGHRYVAAPSAAVLNAYRSYGEEAHAIASELGRDRAGSAGEVEAIALLDHHLSDLESQLARAHRHTDLAEPDSARRYLEAANPLREAIMQDISRLSAAEATRISIATARLHDATRHQGFAFVGVLGVAAIAAALIARWLSRTVAWPLTRLVAHADALAARRTTAYTPADDMPGEFRALAVAMNGASASLVQLAEAEAVANRNQRLALVGQLAAGVAHELNNPLHTILLTVAMLQEDATDPQLRHELDVIRAQAARARETVRNLSGTAQTGVAAREIVPADSIVRRASDELTRLAEVHGGRLQVELPSHSLSQIAANREDLTRAIAILVTNAAQASGPGSSITLRAEEDARGCNFVVEDSGPGLTDDALPRLFEPFFTTKSVGEGTGLGLTLAQGIAESHGGVITAENRAGGPGKGARFTVRIPRVAGDAGRSPAAPTPDTAAAALGSRGAGPHVSPMPALPGEAALGGRHSARARSEVEDSAPLLPRALVVDDEPTVRSVLCRVLARAGWRVDEALDGAVALALIGTAETARDSYRLILSDLRMPTMSGIELHDALARQYPATLERLVITSGDLTSPDVAAFVRRTSCPVLEKPVDLHTLLRVAEDARNSGRGGATREAK